MSYIEFINNAMGLTITQADNGMFYLEPMWQSILEDNEMSFAKSGKLSRHEVLEVLKLQVEKLNTVYSKKNDVIEWIYDVINSTVDPVMLEEENKMVKDLLEYAKLKRSGDYDGDNIIPFPTKE